MTTLAEHIIVAGAKNHPLMLEKSMYDSWESHIRLFIKGKKNCRIMLDSIDEGPLVYPTVIGEDGQTRPKKYSKLTEAQQLQDDCDVQATNIILHGLPPDVMTMQHVQVNTKFLNALPSEWSKFVIDVKYPDPLALIANSYTLYNPSQSPQHSVTPQSEPEFPQLDSGLAIPTFQQGEDPIDCINKVMAFLSIAASRFPPSNNQLKTSSNPRNLATIQDGRVIFQQGKGTWRNNALSQRGQEVLHADPGIAEVQVAQKIIPHNSAFQTEDLDAYDSNCDDISSAKAVLMANLSSCDSDVFFEDNFRENQTASTFNQLFEINELKAQSQEKDTAIKKLNDMIKSLSGKDSVENVKKDIDEIETINIELEHSVAKLLSKNENLREEREHLKLIYKDQFDSIRKTRVQSKEHCDSLIAQINAKSFENLDLNAQLQEKVFAIAALKNELRKLKGKNVVDTAVSIPIATIAPGMFKLDIEPISHRLKSNRDAHEVYLEKTIENTDTLHGLVKCARKQNHSEPLLESACMFTKHIQELLVYVSKTCPSLTKPCEKLVAVTPMNKDKKVRFVKPVTSSSNIPKQTDSLKTKDSNKPLLISTGVNTTTSASGSKPLGNTKKNRIS
ncbi:hypothetical protein Tco_0757812 [Tanacetum coccineum]